MKPIISPLALQRSTATLSQWAAQALLGFMGTLLLIFALALQARTAVWMQSVENHILFEIPVTTPASTTPEIDPQSVRALLQKINGLNDVRILPAEEVQGSLKGWIDNVGVLPLPVLLQATADPRVDAGKLQQAVATQFPGVIVHAGKQAMQDGLQQITSLRYISYMLLCLVLLVGATMSLTTSLWRLDVQDDIVDLLHSMGASRSYIVRDLARFSFVQTLTSAGAGLLGALLLLLIGGLFLAAGPNSMRLLSPLGIAGAACVPLALAALSALTTAWAVRTRYLPFRAVKS